MTCYLVDYENVNRSGLSGIEHLNKGEKVIIYYSEKANLNLKLINEISQSNAKIEYRKITCTKKALLILSWFVILECLSPKIRMTFAVLCQMTKIMITLWHI